MKKLLLVLIPFLWNTDIVAQIEKKVLPARRTQQKVTIDGKLDDAAWKDAALADDFTEFRPNVGRKWRHETRTEAFLMYDDNGIYFGGHCYEATPDSISRELAGRDGFGANDYIGIIFDTYNDQLNGFEYFVTPLGEQWDAKMSSGSDNGGEDFSWNAVWKSAAVIHDKGWDFEMFIPYSAIRFGKAELQHWGLNITRRRRKTEQQNCWNAIDPNVNGFLTQEGTWEGLSNIKPPFRLQLFPYFSFYENHYPSNVSGQKNWSNQVSGGLDIKMGISQAFTIDATLIPDFGQVQSDNRVLNLSPFEVKYNEYRTFFTEGTELFNKANLFYSRRIGGSPIHAGAVYDGLSEQETITHNPAESKLINASKISGRTQKGLGVGILNAVTRRTVAEIEHRETKQIREVETDPLTNYNLFVLDQNLKNNSSINFTNTSVIREGSNANANVSQLMFSLFDKKNTYNVAGNVGISHKNFKGEEDNHNGYKYNLSFSKNSGSFTYGISEDYVDTEFNSNDLGYFTNNNFIDHNVYAGYRILKPKYFYNQLRFNAGFWTSHLAKRFEGVDENFQNAGVRLNINTQLKKLHWMGLFSNYRFVSNDFYETRLVDGTYLDRGQRFLIGTWMESNFAKKYSWYYEVYRGWFINFQDSKDVGINLSQNFRFNTKLSVRFSTEFNYTPNGIGFTAFIDGQSTLAQRKVSTIDNVFSVKYNFNPKNWLTFRARHYSSEVHNTHFFHVNESGKLVETVNYGSNYDRNINFFNIDMVYTYQFAPGSFLNVVWKNNTFKSIDQAQFQYFDNFYQTLAADQNNNLSVKLIYFFDYLTLKKI